MSIFSFNLNIFSPDKLFQSSFTDNSALLYKSGDSAVTKCGVAQEQEDQGEQEKPENTYTRPWHVNVLWVGKSISRV